jgi:hypothetical protein
MLVEYDSGGSAGDTLLWHRLHSAVSELGGYWGWLSITHRVAASKQLPSSQCSDQPVQAQQGRQARQHVSSRATAYQGVGARGVC